MDYWNLAVLEDEQVNWDISEIQTIEFRMNQNNVVIFKSAYVDGKICRIWSKDNSQSSSIVCIDEIYANSLLAVQVCINHIE